MRLITISAIVVHGYSAVVQHAYGSPSSVASIFDPERLSFVTIGDSGRPGPDLYATAETVVKEASQSPITFMAMVGDLVYEPELGTTAEEFCSMFTNPFSGVNVIHPVLGDNDYGDGGYVRDISEFLEMKSADPRWDMPNFYYSKIYKQGRISVCTLFLDTQSLVSIPNPDLRGREEVEFLQGQLIWLEGVLASPECQMSDFILVFGHHPVFSVSKKGNKGIVGETIRAALLPLLSKYHVDAYFSGRDHDLQAMQAKEGHHKISYIVSGASSRLRSSVKHLEHEHLNSWSVKDVIGFTVSEVREDEMVTAFLSSKTGEVLHRHTTRSHKHLRIHESVLAPILLAKGV